MRHSIDHRRAADPAARDGADHGSESAGASSAPNLPRGTWAEAEARAEALIERASGKALADHLINELGARPGAHLLSIGASAGALALELLRHVPGSDMVCIDGRPELLAAGRQRARELAVDAHFAELEPNRAELEPGAFDLVFCHAALYRVSRLEALADQIRRTLRPGGAFLIVDVVARNDYTMWPETREVARAIWKTLPARFRLNHTAYTTPLIDDEIWEPDPNAAPTARSQDILPVLGERFARQHFVPYFSLSRRFFDTMYGPNYDLNEQLDTAVFDWIWQLDLHYLATGRLRPETFFGIYRQA